MNLPTLLVILGLVALTLLLTGPGLWSEKWGWRWFKDPVSRQGRGRPRDPGDQGPR
jgi:FtsZ-interacting cell division protein ZipA